jgi:hypothetical protein
MRRTRRDATEPDDAAYPKVKFAGQANGEPLLTLTVNLAPGQSVNATRDPLWFAGGVAANPTDAGTHWQAQNDGTLCFGTDGATATSLWTNRFGVDYHNVVALDLVLLWTPTLWFEPLNLPGVPGLARVGGTGWLWLLLPGGAVFPDPVDGGQTTEVTADPARLAWIQTAAQRARQPSLEPVPGPGGRTWLRITGAGFQCALHSWPRPS